MAYLRTLLNGWVTDARMKSCKGYAFKDKCVFGCGSTNDSIEHYSCCSIVCEAYEAICGSILQTGLPNFLLLERGTTADQILKRGRFIYAVYNSYN